MNETKTSVRIEMNGKDGVFEAKGDRGNILNVLTLAYVNILDTAPLPLARNCVLLHEEELKTYLQKRQEQEGEAQ